MIEYKASFQNNTNKFQQIIEYLNEIENNINNGPPKELTPTLYHSFYHELPLFLKQLNPQYEQPDAVLNAIQAFYQFSRYNPKDKVARLILNSGALEKLLSLNSDYRVMVYHILNEITTASHEVVIEIIQKGALGFCLDDFFTFDPTINEFVLKIFLNMVKSSFLARALVYSTGIFHVFLQKIENNPAVPLKMLHFISELILVFCCFGPSRGIPLFADEFLNQPSNEVSLNNWNTIMENYFLANIFNRDYFIEFLENGATFISGSPIAIILSNLMKYDKDQTIQMNVLRSFRYLASRDAQVKPYDLCQFLLKGPLNFVSYASFCIESKVIPLIDLAIKDLICIYSPFHISPDRLVSKDAVDFIFALLKNNNTEKLGTIIIKNAALALNNIIASFPNRDLFEDDEEKEILEKLDLIVSYLHNSPFNVQCGMLWLYLNLVSNYIQIEGFLTSFKNNLDIIVDIGSSFPDESLVLMIMRCLKRIFDYDERKTGSSKLQDLFDGVGGFSMISLFWESKNAEIAHKAEKFYDKYICPDLQLNVDLNPENNTGNNDDDKYDDDDDDYASFWIND